MTKEIVDIAVAVLERAAKSEKIGKFICGEYLDGTTRSVADALSGEMVSPKEKKKKYKKKGQKKKKQTNKKNSPNTLLFL